VLGPILDLLKRGVTPHKLALCIAAGAMLGIFPVIGATMALCVIVGYLLRLNAIAIQAVNYAVYPLQIAMLVPFVRMGEWITGSDPFPVSPSAVLAMLQEGIVKTLVHFSSAIIHAVLAWSLLCLPAGLLIYLAFLPILRKSAEHYARLRARHAESTDDQLQAKP